MAPGFHEAVDAVEQGDIERLRRLVQLRPSLLAAVDADDHPSTLLHTAAAGEQRGVVSTLLELGAPVDAMTWATPLHVAASYGRTENARLLLAAGAAFDAQTTLGTTPLALAILHGHPEVVDLLRPHGIVPRTLWVAAGAGELDLVKSFLRPGGTLAEGADQHREDPHEYGLPARPRSDEPRAIAEEALKYACANGRTAVARYLLDAGVSIQSTSHVGTPLHWAAYSGQLEMVKYLLGRGADAGAQDDEWHGTPSGWAAQRSHAVVVEWLRRYEAASRG